MRCWADDPQRCHPRRDSELQRVRHLLRDPERRLFGPRHAEASRERARGLGRVEATPAFALLYDVIRWEEKALVQAAEKRGVKVSLVDLKETDINLSGGGPD